MRRCRPGRVAAEGRWWWWWKKEEVLQDGGSSSSYNLHLDLDLVSVSYNISISISTCNLRIMSCASLFLRNVSQCHIPRSFLCFLVLVGVSYTRHSSSPSLCCRIFLILCVYPSLDQSNLHFLLKLQHPQFLSILYYLPHSTPHAMNPMPQAGDLHSLAHLSIVRRAFHRSPHTHTPVPE